MVYISSSALTSSARQAVMQAQTDLAKTQAELSSGQLADVGLGLGAQSSQLVSLTQQRSRLQSITDSNTLASTRLSSTASALDSLNTTASSFLSTLTAAASGSSTTTLQTAAQSALGALTSTLNTAVSGQYIFGGINSGQQPMTAYTASPASTTKQAVDSSFTTAFGVSQTSAAAASISGTAVQSYLDGAFAAQFGAASFQGSWSSASDQVMTSQISASETVDTSVSANSSAFRKLAQAYTMVSEFSGKGLGADAQQAVIASATTLVSSALSDLTSTQAGVGIAQSSISDANDRMSSQITLLSSQSDAMTSVDSYSLSTRLSGLQTQIEASYEMTSKLQQMSLVNYLT